MQVDDRSNRLGRGFTLVEMLIVIGILGILASVLIGSFSHVKTTARQQQAQTLAAEVATAFNAYLQKEQQWPDEFLDRTEMDQAVCRVMQGKKLIDLSTYSNVVNKVINPSSLDRYGLLDPWGRAALQRNAKATENTAVESGGTVADHRIQFRLDLNYDGYVDTQDYSDVPEGVKIRRSVIAWSRGPDGQDDFKSKNPKAKGRYPYDDRLSWNHAQARAEK